MTVPQIANDYAVAVGTSSNAVGVPYFSQVNPSSTNIHFPQGKRWINEVANSVWDLTSFSSSGGVLSANWVSVGGGSSEVSTLTGDNAVAVSPTSGNINLYGTANQIVTAASGSTITWTLSPTLVGPGSITATTSLTATLGNITATNGNLVLGTAGNKIVSSHVSSTTTAGANSFGTVVLVSGTATVSTTAVTASSLIVLWRQSGGSTGANPIGELVVGTITAGTSFVISAISVSSATTVVTTDVSVVGWMIIN